jgi:tellurite resistance protein TerC
MTETILFPFADYWGLYLAFTAGVVLLLLLDLGVFHREAHVVSAKEAGAWSAVWISLALAFNVGLYFYASWAFAGDPRLQALPGFDPDAAAWRVALEFLTGFVIEKSLAVDNIFVFVVVFTYFGIPARYQHRVLFFGILGALVFRAGFIALGAALLQYHWLVIAAGVFLVVTGVKILFTPDAGPDPAANPLLRLVRRLVPVTPGLDGQRFFVRREGVLHATPLFLALAFIEFSDIVFAIDSVPAIFAITAEPFLVFTSNVFAILGLRSLYFLLAGVIDRFHYLKYGLGLILIFVGSKMAWLNEAFGGKFPTTWSLGIIGGILGAAALASLLMPVHRAPDAPHVPDAADADEPPFDRAQNE